MNIPLELALVRTFYQAKCMSILKFMSSQPNVNGYVFQKQALISPSFMFYVDFLS